MSKMHEAKLHTLKDEIAMSAAEDNEERIKVKRKAKLRGEGRASEIKKDKKKNVKKK